MIMKDIQLWVRVHSGDRPILTAKFFPFHLKPGLQILQSTEKSLRFQGDGGKIAWLSVEFSGRRFLSGLLMFDSLGVKSTRELTMLKSSRTWNLSSSDL
ncbi:hypothetical protein SESBI_45116 [Sesbania bispinosa]|nr:hypothetical protein SESBI_45116 [Sesbania bispinosa]